MSQITHIGICVDGGNVKRSCSRNQYPSEKYSKAKLKQSLVSCQTLIDHAGQIGHLAIGMSLDDWLTHLRMRKGLAILPSRHLNQPVDPFSLCSQSNTVFNSGIGSNQSKRKPS